MKSVIVHGVLALVGLVLAYRTWTHEEKDEQLPGEVTVAECDASKLTSIEIESPTHTVVYRPKRTAGATEYWITTQTKPKPKPETKPDAKTPATPATPAADAKDAKGAKKDEKVADKTNPAQKPAETAPKPPEPPKPARAFDPDAPVTFLANKKFVDETLKSLAPLRAVRSLGEIPKAKFKDFGFDKVGTYLRVDCGGHKQTLEVGVRTYGGGDQYTRESKTKQAYLFSGQLLMDLQSAQYKFMQSELHDFTLADVDEVVVKAAGKERRLLHRNRLVPQEARWVDAAAPDKRNELFGNWFQRVERLKAKSYLDEGKEPGSDLQISAKGQEPVMTLEYRLEGKPKGKLELARVDTDQGGIYYARTEATHRWTAMYDSLAKQAEEDVAMVVGAEEQKATPSDQSKASAPGHAGHPPAASTPPPLPPSHPPIGH
jgi:hypothetical protein